MDATQGIGGSLRRLDTVARDAGLIAPRPGSERTPLEVGKQFEQMLAGLMVREMRHTLPTGFFGEGAGADTYDSWLDEHVGQAIADSGSLNIAGMVQENATRLQAAARSAAQEQIK